MDGVGQGGRQRQDGLGKVYAQDVGRNRYRRQDYPLRHLRIRLTHTEERLGKLLLDRRYDVDIEP